MTLLHLVIHALLKRKSRNVPRINFFLTKSSGYGKLRLGLFPGGSWNFGHCFQTVARIP